MADYNALARQVIEALGGKENITFATHCVTRLRFNLRDKGRVDQEQVKEIPGVLGCQFSGEQFQVIIGPTVNQAYEAVLSIGGFDRQAAVDENLDQAHKEPLTAKSIAALVLDGLSGSLTPMIPAVIAGGLLMMIVNIIGPTMLGIVSTDSDLYVILNIAANAPYYFLPMIVGYAASKKFGAETVISLSLAGVMLSPTLVDIVEAGTPLTVFGIPMTLVNYSSSVFPMLLVVFAQSLVERGLKRIIPDSAYLIFVPVLTIVVMLPIALCVLGPLGSWLGMAIYQVLNALHNAFGPLGMAALAALYMPLVATGMHTPIIMMALATLTTTGSEDFIFVAGAMATFGSIGTGLGSTIRARNPHERELALSCFISQTLVGVGEPTIFGLLIPHPRLMLCAMLGAFAGGAFAGLVNCICYSPLVSNLYMMPLGFIGGPDMSSFVNALIGGAIAFAVSLVLVLVLGYDGKKKATEA